MVIYVDGSALTRALPDSAEHEAWRAWCEEHRGALVTTPVGLTELRGASRPRGMPAREVAATVERDVALVRISDQALKVAAMAAGVLPPLAALHLGTAVSHPEVTALVTYDELLARVAGLYGVEVLSPGREPGWWRD